MADPETPIHIDAQDASSGAKTGAMRYVLAISLVLVIAIFAWILLAGR